MSRPDRQRRSAAPCSKPSSWSMSPTCMDRPSEHDSARPLDRSAAYRTHLGVPMLKDSELSRRHRDLSPGGAAVHATSRSSWCTNFAAQAVIAIENTRLLNELRQRTDDLQRIAGAADRDHRGAQGHQQLDRRSASRCSDTLVESAARLCEAEFGIMYPAARAMRYRRGRQLRRHAELSQTCRRESIRSQPDRSRRSAARCSARQVVHSRGRDRPTPNSSCPTHGAACARRGRTIVGVPMLRGHELVGAIGI